MCCHFRIRAYACRIRLSDVFVLPSKSGETWGLTVNEALACGRPVLVSDRVGCAADVADRSCGRVFPWNDLSALERAINEMSKDQNKLRECAERPRNSHGCLTYLALRLP